MTHVCACEHIQDDRAEGCALILSCENNRITSSGCTAIDRRALEPAKKHTPCLRTEETLQRDGRRGATTLKSNPIPARDSWKAQTKPCAQQDQGRGAVTPTGDRARPACECLRVSCGGVGQQRPAAGSGALTAPVGGARHVSISSRGAGCCQPHHRGCNATIETADSRTGPPQAKLQAGSTAPPSSRKLG